MLDEKTLELFDNLTLDSMPITGKLYDAIANFIKVERVSDEKDFENDKLAFTIQIREYEDSLIKIECDNLMNEDTNHVVVYNTIDGELVNVMEDNENYRKYYGRSLSRTYKGWTRYLDRGGVFDEDLGEELRYLQNTINPVVNLYISESLNFYNDPFFIFNNVELRDFSNEDGLPGLLRRKKGLMDETYTSRLMFDIDYGTLQDLIYGCNPTHYFTNDNVVAYMTEMLLRMAGFRNAAIIEKFNKSSTKIYQSIYRTGKAPIVCTLCMINNNIEYFKKITEVYLSVYKNHNLIDKTMTSLFNTLIGILLNVDDYEEYIDSVLYEDCTSYENTGVSTYGKCAQYVENMRKTRIDGKDFLLVDQTLAESVAYATLNPKDLVKFDKLRDAKKVEVVYEKVNGNGSIIRLHGIYVNGVIIKPSDLINKLELYFRTYNTVTGKGGRIHELYEPMRIFRG